MEERKILVQVRLPQTLVREVDHIRIDGGFTRQQAIQMLIVRAIEGLTRDEATNALFSQAMKEIKDDIQRDGKHV